MAANSEVRGINSEGVSAWLEESIPDLTGPFTFELIAGGRSNLTYRVLDRNGRAVALRRPPASHVLPTAHDMIREHRIISALHQGRQPVPIPLGVCEDEGVNERPFYVMEFVDGHLLRSEAQAMDEFSEEARAAIGPNIARTLARLHQVDPDKVGLGDLARREGYLDRQLRRWSSQLEQMTVEGETHTHAVSALGKRLAGAIPTQQATAIVQADYRVDNLILDDQGQVRAILDWELSTLGDPLADLGTLWMYWLERPDDDLAFLGELSATAAPGFCDRSALIAAYANETTLDLSPLPYYRAFALWRLACILQGVYRRTSEGAAGGNTGSVEQFPLSIERLAVLGEVALEEMSS
jgi:hypothetical protein